MFSVIKIIPSATTLLSVCMGLVIKILPFTTASLSVRMASNIIISLYYTCLTLSVPSTTLYSQCAWVWLSSFLLLLPHYISVRMGSTIKHKYFPLLLHYSQCYQKLIIPLYTTTSLSVCMCLVIKILPSTTTSLSYFPFTKKIQNYKLKNHIGKFGAVYIYVLRQCTATYIMYNCILI